MLKTGLNGYHIDFFFTYMAEKGMVENGVFYRGLNSCPRPLSRIERFKWNDLAVKIPAPMMTFFAR